MSTSNKIPIQRVQLSYQRLSSAASKLNAATDDLSRAVLALDEALKRLNLGVTSWHDYASGGQDNSPFWWDRGIGYARIGNRWGIALRRRSGTDEGRDSDKEECWLFNDAPRHLRIEAIDQIAALVDKLIADAEKTIEMITDKASATEQLARALAGSAAPPAK